MWEVVSVSDKKMYTSLNANIKVFREVRIVSKVKNIVFSAMAWLLMISVASMLMTRLFIVFSKKNLHANFETPKAFFHYKQKQNRI